MLKVAIIGRSEIMYDIALKLEEAGHLIVCIITAKEAPEYSVKANDFYDLAKVLNVPFAQSADILKYKELIHNSSADIGVSINFSGIIPGSITSMFPFGILNAHGGDLPRYRGNACQAWAILNGEDKIGLCIHRMIGGELDSGDIIAREYLPIDYNTKVTDVWEWFKRRIPALFVQAVNQLSIDPAFVLEIQSKDPKDAHHCYPRLPEDGRIVWRQSALSVLRLINASNKPYAGAVCDFERQQFIIWDAELVEEFENFCAVPGQITRIGNGFVEVACGEGKIRILSAEYGGEVSSPNVWIKSIRKRLT
ncbi:MAG: formyltransferase family protein [Bacteroidales bacterium]|jgi:UDP-4-amino-4-deoxy-L-arabinose formyltransferase/UDP-glucuronic acid dehydrogenase (UDP-4-keto-hexauronic acid decarboxylating)